MTPTDGHQNQSNSARVSRARQAAETYLNATRHSDSDCNQAARGLYGATDPYSSVAASEVITDLLCDLNHLADQTGLTWAELVAHAADHHAAERRDALDVAGEQRTWRPRCDTAGGGLAEGGRTL